MGTFLNKKEQVIDLKITSYGKHKLGSGDFKPEFYAFFDDNVIYDSSYFGRTENQNDTDKRIKRETHYLEGQILFKDIEKLPDPENLVQTTDDDGEPAVYFKSDVTPSNSLLREDTYRIEQMIGDAYLEGETQNIPAWKLVTLQGEISDSSPKLMSGTIGTKFDLEIPQVNIELNYRLKVRDSDSFTPYEEQNFEDAISPTDLPLFSDSKFIDIEHDDLMIYLEEVNTMMLNENFEVEIFEVDNVDESLLKRKEYKKDYLSLKGDMITEEYIKNTTENFMPDVFTENDVEYFFEIEKDQFVNRSVACKGTEIYNKNSYYIDLDFECTESVRERTEYYDIYGPVTEPEICQ